MAPPCAVRAPDERPRGRTGDGADAGGRWGRLDRDGGPCVAARGWRRRGTVEGAGRRAPGGEACARGVARIR